MKPHLISCLTFFMLANFAFAQEVCNQKIHGTITDSLTNQVLSKSQIVLYDIDKESYNRLQKGNETIFQNTEFLKKKVVSSDAEGFFELNVECNKYYRFIVTINGFVSQEKFLNTFELRSDLAINFSLENQEVYKDENNRFLVKVNPINFEINSSKISKESKKELNKVVMLLKKYVNFEVEIGVHSSSLGSDTFNLNLTTERANAISAYISSFDWEHQERLTAIGYGETKIINECINGVKCHPKKHQENKRIEFVVKSIYKPGNNFDYLKGLTISN